MEFKRIIECLGGKDRQEQLDLLNDLMANVDGISGFNAGTGIGKTLAYCVAAMSSPGASTIVVPTIQLAKQVERTIDRLNGISDKVGLVKHKSAVRMGLREYLSPSKVASFESLFDEAEDKATYDALLNASKARDESNCYSAYINEYEALPPGLTRHDVCCDAQTKDSGFLLIERDIEKDVDILIVSQVTVLTELAFNSLPGKFRTGRLIVDEADSLVAMASSVYSKKISLKALVRRASKYPSLIRRCNHLQECVDSLPCRITWLSNEPNTWLALTSLAEEAQNQLGQHNVTEQLFQFCELGISNASVSKNERSTNFIQMSKFAARIMKSRFDRFECVWLLSGTLDITSKKDDSMQWLSGKLGISGDVGFYKNYEPKKYGEVDFCIGRGAKTMIDKQLNPKFIEFCAMHADASMLICTVSHEETEMLAEAIRRDNKVKVIEDRSSIALSDIIDEFVSCSGKAVLVTARGGVGMDIRLKDGSQIVKQLMITRLPFLPPPDEGEMEWLADSRGLNVDRLMGYEYMDGIQKSVRRFVQAFGRGIRDEDDVCRVMIMDSRFPSFNSTSKHTIFRDALPKRFVSKLMNAEYIGDDAKKAEVML